jgi:hypothetical protein
MKKFAVILLGFSTLALQGCIDRDQADKKIAEACAAGVASQLPEGWTVEETKMSGFAETDKGGAGSREVKITLSVKDGFAVSDKSYACIFFEEFGPLKLSYTATIYQLAMDDGTLIGQEGLTQQGTLEQVEKLNQAVEKVLNK